MKFPWLNAPVALLILSIPAVRATVPMRGELTAARRWSAAKLEDATAEPLFSFRYHGTSSSKLLKRWPVNRASRELDAQRTEHTITYREPDGGLVVRLVIVEYHDFPTVEWTLYLRNAGAGDSPILEDIQAADFRIPSRGRGDFVLHHAKGSPATSTDYEPLATRLQTDQPWRVSALGGRPTNSDLCYFDFDWSGEGLVLALGWPGQWSAEFLRDEASGLRIRAGQELTHLRLHPGEEIRSPLIALQFWKGDWIRAQNIWRSWMLAHNLPRDNGRPLGPASWVTNTDLMDYTKVTTANQTSFVDRFLAEGIKPNYWEMDAGWYENDGRWQNVGTWAADPKRFPGGLGPLCQSMHARGLKTHIWFEPERVTRGSWLWVKHPEWLLQCPSGERRDQRLLNLGDPRAYQWLVATLDHFIAEGIDFYRTDFNFDPLAYWRGNDAPDRQGMTENKYVTSFLACLDELRRLHPMLLVDNCASGGRRNDLETLRRGVPITRSDYGLEPIGDQNITYGIAFWIPVYGCGTRANDLYKVRSSWAPRYGFAWDTDRKDLDYAFIRRVAGEWRNVADYFLGDYYPLTEYDSGPRAWMAWEFDRPDLGTGMVQIFRRADCPRGSVRVRLGGLRPGATYEVTSLDRLGTTEMMAGRRLLDDGLPVNFPSAPAALIFTYRVKKLP